MRGVKGKGGEKKEGKKVYTTTAAVVSIPIISFPYSLERGPVLEEAFILWLFVLSRERSAIFSPPQPPARAHHHGENKNEKLDPCGENDFLPARLAFFHTAPPGPINTGNHRFFLLSAPRTHSTNATTSCALKLVGAFFLPSLLFFFP